MKRSVLSLILFILLLCLTACAGEEEKGTAAAAAGTFPAPVISPLDGGTLSSFGTKGSDTGIPEADSAAGTEETASVPEVTAAPTPGKTVFRFAGDFTQAELGGDGVTMAIMDVLDNTYGGDITRCFSDDLLELMADADIFMLNNEFTYSDRGTPVSGKDWTFRATPGRVKNLTKLGVDCVGLANNHCYDWGRDAMLDTIDVLDAEGIEHCGTGKNIEEAKKAIYYDINGRRFSIISASSVEKEWEPEYGMTKAATADSAGMLRCTDPPETLDAIRTAKSDSDFCFVFVHWGVEMETMPDDEQRSLARQFIEAGADAVIGMHPHILQGMEFIEGKPVIYSLGNYWFNSRTRSTCLFEVAVDNETLGADVTFYPCLQSECRTVLVTKADKRSEALEAERALSFNVDIDSEGHVTEK